MSLNEFQLKNSISMFYFLHFGIYYDNILLGGSMILEMLINKYNLKTNF